jgi:hypothetical protein
MISVECREYDTDGIALLDDAVELARREGIANAVGAVSRDVLRDFDDFSTCVGHDLLLAIPGIIYGGGRNGVTNYRIIPQQAPAAVQELLEGVEEHVVRAAGDRLPGWNPTKWNYGMRMVVMQNTAHFPEHTDKYEGLVASTQLAVEDEKILRAKTRVGWEYIALRSGDITLFGCDTFSDCPRRTHGLTSRGGYAIALTLGQNPDYTISGRLPHYDRRIRKRR